MDREQTRVESYEELGRSCSGEQNEVDRMGQSLGLAVLLKQWHRSSTCHNPGHRPESVMHDIHS